MFGSRDRRSWCLLSPHELGLDPKLNLEPLNYLSHSFVYLVFCTASVASFPVPRPAFPRFTVLSSDEKLGVGLGTRLLHQYTATTMLMYT